MSTNVTTTPTSKSSKSRDRRLPPGHRVLHIEVPETIFNAAKAQALLKGINWPKFVIQLLADADPRKGDLPND